MPATKKYTVSADCHVEYTIEVEAASREEALEAAQKELEASDISQWDFKDGKLRLAVLAEDGQSENHL